MKKVPVITIKSKIIIGTKMVMSVSKKVVEGPTKVLSNINSVRNRKNLFKSRPDK